MLPNKVYNDINQHAHQHIEHHNYNFQVDPPGAINAVMAENKKLKVENENLQELVQLLKEKVAQLQAQASSATKANPSSLSMSGPSASEFEQLKKDLAQAKRELQAAQQELGVLKTDIDNFKIWTKKLDWSTTEQPTWLNKYFDIKQAKDVKGTLTTGTPHTVSGQQVDGVLHGPAVWTDSTTGTVIRENRVDGASHGVRMSTQKGSWPGEVTGVWWMGKNLNKNIKQHTDGSVSYKCADEHEDGVSVGVMTQTGQKGNGYALKNGYCIELHLYKEEICLQHYQNSAVSAKWYQLKK